jgi:hypothetical protein
MTRNRAALAIPAAVLVLSGCGVAAAVTAHTKTVSVVIPRSSVSDGLRLQSLPRPAISPVVPVVAPPRPTAPASSAYLVTTVATSGVDVWLEIVSRTGGVVARTLINPTQGWMTAAGAGGAYWTQSGAEFELTPSGAVHKLGSVPSDATAVLIGPDGRSYAFATNDLAKSGVATNRIVVVRPGVPAVTIADRISDPNHPTPDAPQSWQYYLINWTGSGIVFARVPSGGCGCGSFDMQMQSAFSGAINPTSEVVTPLTADQSCPLSGVGPGLETACFTSTTGGSTGLRVSTGSVVRYHFAMSGANIAGDAVFSATGTTLAYITIPTTETTCGSDWTATLRVLNLATGSVVSRTLGEFAPAAWSSTDGLIYGTVSVASGSVSTLVAVNPATLSVTRLSPAGSNEQFVGVM